MPLDEKLVMRCEKSEKEAWVAYAKERKMPLSAMVRLMLNNATGINDPPIMSPWSTEELVEYAGHFAGTAKQRRARRAAAAAAAAVTVFILCGIVHGDEVWSTADALVDAFGGGRIGL